MVLSDEASITVPDAPIMNRLRRSLEDGLPSAGERENMKERSEHDPVSRPLRFESEDI